MTVHLNTIRLQIQMPTRTGLLHDCRRMFVGYALWCQKNDRALDDRLHWEISSPVWRILEHWPATAAAGRLQILHLPVLVFDSAALELSLKVVYGERITIPDRWQPCLQ